MDNERIEKATTLFKEGYNCSQSVVAAFADKYGFTREQALKMSASFGGGIGRMRETCGAACGIFLLAGLETGATEGSDSEGKAANYKLVQELAEEFQLYSNDGQVFISTHSPDFLNAVPLESIYCLVRRDGFTTIKRAMDNATVKALVEAGDLPGTLWRENLLAEETL